MSCIELLLIFFFVLFAVDILFSKYVTKLVKLIKPIQFNNQNLNFFLENFYIILIFLLCGIKNKLISSIARTASLVVTD